MKQGLTVAIIVGAIMVAFLLLRPRVKEYLALPSQYEAALVVVGQLESVLESKSLQYEAVMAESLLSQKKVDSLRSYVAVLGSQIESLEKELSQVEIEVPDVPVVVAPEDMEECLNELELARIYGEHLRSNVVALIEENRVLKSLNSTRGLVIENQHEIILTQREDIKRLKKAYSEDVKSEKTKKIIAYTLAVVMAGLNLF